MLPEEGALAGAGAVEVRVNGDVLEFTGNGWKRTARLVEGTLTIEQSSALPPDRLMPGKRANVSLTIERPSTGTAVYRLN